VQIEPSQQIAPAHASPTFLQFAQSEAAVQTLLDMLPNLRQQPEAQPEASVHVVRQIGFGVAFTHSVPAQHVAPGAPHSTFSGKQVPGTPDPEPPRAVCPALF
jgi:hypothetical protein